MAAGKKILIGCGLGCGGVILLIVLSGVGSAFWLADTMEGFHEAIDLRAELETRHGAVEAYVPTDDGGVSPDRMTAFLAVRDVCSETRQQIAGAFGRFPMSDKAARELHERSFFEKVGAMMNIGGAALGLPAQLGQFFTARNQALLDHDMGLGEYTYIYVLAYNVWLDHSPQDRPGGGRININGMNDDLDDDDGDDELTDRDQPFDLGLDRRIRRNLIQMLQNQLQDVESREPGGAWSTRLTAEIELLEQDAGRLPWADGLPDALVASFEPYREQLESTYSPVTNMFELGRNRQRNSFSIEAD